MELEIVFRSFEISYFILQCCDSLMRLLFLSFFIVPPFYARFAGLLSFPRWKNVLFVAEFQRNVKHVCYYIFYIMIKVLFVAMNSYVGYWEK